MTIQYVCNTGAAPDEYQKGASPIQHWPSASASASIAQLWYPFNTKVGPLRHNSSTIHDQDNPKAVQTDDP